MIAPRPWKTLSSRYVLDDPWLKVRADDCETAEGRKVAPYYVVELPDFVHVAAITARAELVVVRQYRQGTQRIHLELPAGIIEAQDADPVDAARRELLEETGYEADGWRRLAVWNVNPARQANRQHLIIADQARSVAAQKLDGAESLTVELLPLDDAMDAVLSGAFDSTQHIAAVLRLIAELRR